MKRPSRILVALIATGLVGSTWALAAETIPRSKRLLTTLFETEDRFPEGERFWMAAHGLQVTNAENGVGSLVYAPDGRHIYIADEGDHSGSTVEAGSIQRWDLTRLAQLWSVKPFEPTLYQRNYPSIDELVLSPNGQLLAAIPSSDRIGAPHSLVLLDTDSGRTIRTQVIESFFAPCAGTRNGKPIVLAAHDAFFTKDSRGLIVFYKNQYGDNYSQCQVVQDRWLIHYDVDTFQIKWKYQVRTPAVPSMGIRENSCSIPQQSFATALDGRTIFVADCVGTIASVDVATGREGFRSPPYVATARAHNFPGFHSIINIIPDPLDDDRLLLTVGDSGSKTMIAQFKISSRSFLDRLVTGVTDSLPRLRTSPDGRALIVGGKNLYMWDRQTDRVLFMTYEHNGWAYDLQVNPKFQEVVSVAGQDLVFYQPREKRDPVRATRDWNNTGLRAQDYTALYARTTGDDFYISWGPRHIDAYDYTEVLYHGLQDDYYVRGGGVFSVRTSGSPSSIEIYGGVGFEETETDIRRRMIPWGQYWSNMGLLVDDGAPEEEAPQESEDDFEIEVVAAEDAEDEYKYAINTSRPGLLLGALRAGADVNTRMSLEDTGLIASARMGEEKLVEILIEHDANLDLKNFAGVTALMGAAYNGELAVAGQLIDAGADLNIQSNNGYTALMNAARGCRLPLVRRLLAAGARNDLKNGDGETAYDIARSNCQYSLTQQMEAAGLKP